MAKTHKYKEGQVVEVDIRRWLNAHNKGRPKWKSATITDILSAPGQYTTTLGVFNEQAMRKPQEVKNGRKKS